MMVGFEILVNVPRDKRQEFLQTCELLGNPDRLYALIKKKVLGFLKQYGPPNKVSRLRYRIGLVMFCFRWYRRVITLRGGFNPAL